MSDVSLLDLWAYASAFMFYLLSVIFYHLSFIVYFLSRINNIFNNRLVLSWTLLIY